MLTEISIKAVKAASMATPNVISYIKLPWHRLVYTVWEKRR